MLALTRRTGETLLIKNKLTGEQMTISLVRTTDNRAVIGIDAPRTWDIVRAELLIDRQVSQPTAG